MHVTAPVVDPPVDMATANITTWSDCVLHIYNDDYLGIRAAASALPGHKLVLPRRSWSREFLEQCHEAVLRLSLNRVVFHGMSEAITSVARFFAWKSPRLRLFGVYHGNVSQWNDPQERSAAKEFLRLDAEGTYFRSHILKPGGDSVLRSPAPKLLVNCAPRDLVNSSPGRSRGIAFIPAPDIWRKNIYANAVASELADSVDSLWHYADLSDSPYPITKSRRLAYRTPECHRDFLRASNLVLNATIVDCHPMVDLEANAVGKLSLHAKYRLGVLEDHPAERLQALADPTDVDQIRSQVDAAISLSTKESSSLARDFAECMTRESILRYAMFLDLE